MVSRKLTPQRITPESFAPFGRLIDLPRKGFVSPGKNLWKIVVRQSGRGWRIAYLVVRDKKVFRLERHEDTRESFEPVKGKGVLFVARRADKAAIKCFWLDKPVVLEKGVWHGVIAFGREADIKIVENAAVRSRFWPLNACLCLKKKDIYLI